MKALTKIEQHVRKTGSIIWGPYRKLWKTYTAAIVIASGFLAFYLQDDYNFFTGAPTAFEEAAPIELDDAGEGSADDGDISSHGVSSVHPIAVNVGNRIMNEGGNAVDAAIAISFALGVVEPYGSGIAGGGMSLITDGDETTAFDYRETAPKRDAEDYGGYEQMVDPADPALSAGVPGFVRGMERMYAEEGSETFEFNELIQPAYELSEQGFSVDSELSSQLSSNIRYIGDFAGETPFFDENAEAVQENEILEQPALANVLKDLKSYYEDLDTFEAEALAEDEKHPFYGLEYTSENNDVETNIAQILTGEGEHSPEGLDGYGLSMEDIDDYEVQVLETAEGTFGDYTVSSGTPPSGGITTIQLLELIEKTGLEDHFNEDGDHEYDKLVPKLANIISLVYDDRLISVADPSFITREDISTRMMNAIEERETNPDNILPAETNELALSEQNVIEHEQGLDPEDYHELLTSEEYIRLLQEAAEELEKTEDEEIPEETPGEPEVPGPEDEQPAPDQQRDDTEGDGPENDNAFDEDQLENEETQNDATNTTHFSVRDSDGKMIAVTNTLSEFFGSGEYVEYTAEESKVEGSVGEVEGNEEPEPYGGFFMNNQLTNFSMNVPGTEDVVPEEGELPEQALLEENQIEESQSLEEALLDEGLLPLNRYESGKRPRSYISPTILVEDGEPVMSIGSPGGKRIPAMLAQTLMHLEYNDEAETLQEAIEEPRIFAESDINRDDENDTLFIDNGVIYYEEDFRDMWETPLEGDSSQSIYENLREDPSYSILSHSSAAYFGGIQGLYLELEPENEEDDEELQGGADPRRDGHVDIIE
ncbi:gamma-glutamyltranspeptidase [Salsuginibacillus halophilus]|uniref:Gamma-glutamyltranspeptidase n=1 Tax=Salsuginibacillus halophilus TaxID=517424 RepID=A0A2P8H907_9BACI|nr:gamma-glutamyltransferase [Salsuginibacillus halophilus]PSL42715.1 gamma-glutamyltranspeptidase [Salsuginibacillus halophilus]